MSEFTMKAGSLRRIINQSVEKVNGGQRAPVRRRQEEEPLNFANPQQMIRNETLQSRSRTNRGDGSSILDLYGRDLNEDCGYPDWNPSIDMYRVMYEQEGVAARIVGLMPSECWGVYPDLYERADSRVTQFEKAWASLNEKINIWHYLCRADRLSRIGKYGVMLLGLPGNNLENPVKMYKEGEARPEKLTPLLYLRPFAEYDAAIDSLEGDVNNPRYGQPLYYNLNLMNAQDSASIIMPFNGSVNTVGAGKLMKVHWTRVMHFADNRDDSDVFGVEAMRPHWRRLMDLRKLYAGSAEMYWQGAFPGFTFDPFPEVDDDEDLDIDAIEEQLQNYMNHLQRYIAAIGGTFRSLAPQVVDPTPQIMAQIGIICAVLGCPLRTFMGSADGQKASDIDKLMWNGRVAERQKLYCEPMMARPTVQRLSDVNVLPVPKRKLKMDWADKNTTSDKDKADVTIKLVQSGLQYCSSGMEVILPLNQFYTRMMKLSQSEADELEEKVRGLFLESGGSEGKYVTEKLWANTARAMQAANSKGRQGPASDAQNAGNDGIRSPNAPVGGSKK